MTKRQEQILEYSILEYMRTSEPVSSFQLLKAYALPYSSATIRNELGYLEEEGFLTQIHASSGRIPSDKGYRYYVNRLLARQEILRQYIRSVQSIWDDLETMKEIHMKLKQLLLSIASASGNLALGKLSSDIVFEEGMNQFLQNPYFSSMEFIQQALTDLDAVKVHIDDIGNTVKPGQYQLYIGEENPLPSLQKYSVIVGRCEFDGDNGTIIMIGPKSMQYAKNIALIEYVLNPDYNDEE